MLKFAFLEAASTTCGQGHMVFDKVLYKGEIDQKMLVL